MNLLGIDVGTTGCKVALFSTNGVVGSAAYREYGTENPRPGWAQLDATAVWEEVKAAIREVAGRAPEADIRALAVSSLGEAVVPVSEDRRIMGPSILNYDIRGEEFLADLARLFPDETLYAVNGNTLGNHYSLTKLKWIQAHQPELYGQTYKFLHWSGFISFMLGAEPVVDFTLANRSLLFDLQAGDWSNALLEAADLDRCKLPAVVHSGAAIGTVAAHIAADLGLPPDLAIIAGAHDQCANAIGSGVIDAGKAVYGMGTFHCITPVFSVQPESGAMIARGLNTEHHAVPGRFVSFLYNQGGSLVRWYRDTFAAAEHQQALADGDSVYPELFAELRAEASRVMVLPHFASTGPPQFITDSAGLIAGLRLDTHRGEVLKGIIEGAAFYLKEVVDLLPATGIQAEDYRAVGGGSQADVWVQSCADIFGQPITRPMITEAGALGAAIVAGVGSGLFESYERGVQEMVRLDRTFEPDERRHDQYQLRYQLYQKMWPLLGDYLREMSAGAHFGG